MTRPRFQRENHTEHYTYVADEDENPPQGVENARNYSEDLDKGTSFRDIGIAADTLPQVTKSFKELEDQQVKEILNKLLKQYPDIGAGIGVREGQSVNPVTYGGQYLSQKPEEPTATIEPGLGAGKAPISDTYPYPTNPDPALGQPSYGEVIQPKLQVQGDTAESYGVTNIYSNTMNYGAPADQALTQTVERVSEAVRREVMNELMTPSDPMTIGEESSRLPMKQDGNEILNPDGTITNGPAGNNFVGGGNPPAKLPVTPGLSGSSEVFRQDLPPGHEGFTTEQAQKQEDTDAKGPFKSNFPTTLIFDWNGTVDARGNGQGIPLDFLVYLKEIGKNVVVFTSSTKSEDKLFMRQVLDQRQIPYTDNEDILDKGDIYIADKNSDRRRAGRHGIKYIDINDFDLDKILAKSVSKQYASSGVAPRGDPASLEELPTSLTIPGMNRTVIGDKWQPGYNVMENRENGVPVILNTPTHYDLVTQALGARGFVTNDNNGLYAGLRYEHKMNGNIARINGSSDNQRLEVEITDRTGAVEFVTDRWDQLDAYLNEKYPNQSE